eukprot:13110266-Alexandrium_andersonii.AAC.1
MGRGSPQMIRRQRFLFCSGIAKPLPCVEDLARAGWGGGGRARGRNTVKADSHAIGVSNTFGTRPTRMLL